MRQELASLSAEVKGQGSVLSEVRADLSEVRADLKDLGALTRKLLIKVTNHDVELAEIRDYMTTKLVTRTEFTTRFESLSGDMDAIRRDRAMMSSLYMAHEDRISALEGKKA